MNNESVFFSERNREKLWERERALENVGERSRKAGKMMRKRRRRRLHQFRRESKQGQSEHRTISHGFTLAEGNGHLDQLAR